MEKQVDGPQQCSSELGSNSSESMHLAPRHMQQPEQRYKSVSLLFIIILPLLSYIYICQGYTS